MTSATELRATLDRVVADLEAVESGAANRTERLWGVARALQSLANELAARATTSARVARHEARSAGRKR